MADSTLKQIAKELSLSVSTVSRAVNGKSVVNADTKKRVLELAEKYSYTPNEVARSLQKCSTETVAVVLPDISENFFGTIVKEIDSTVSKEGYMLLLADTHERADKENKYLDMLYKRQVDALVLATVDIDGSSSARFRNGGKPVIFIDNVPKAENIDAITIDNKKASFMAVEYLKSQGHKKIATIIGSKEETTGAERLEGYRDALKKLCLSENEDLIAFGDYKRESGYVAMKKLLENRENAPFSAVFVTSEKMTYGALDAIKEASLSVPEDISLIGFDVHERYKGGHKIASIRQPEEEIGKLVGKQLLSKLKNQNSNGEHILLEPLLYKGDTVKAV